MRIGIDCRLWNQTGVGRYARNLVANLYKIDKKNDYTLFVSIEDLQNIQRLFKNPRWKVVEADIKWHTFSEQINYLQILNKENLDLVHFPYLSAPIFYKRPFIVTIHDLIPMLYPTGKASTLILPLYYLKYLAFRVVIKKISKKARRIIVPSFATKSEVLKHLNVSEDKIIVTYEAADNNLKSQTAELNSLSFKDGQYFLYVGNAYPHKNLDKFIAAFKKLKANLLVSDSKIGKNIKFVLVGDKGYFYKRLELMTKSKDVIFYGKASDEELAALYKNALAAVQPSLMEGFGLPVLEAMANKCLVACSDIPSLREIAKENALYFNPQDADEMEKILESIISNSKSYENMTKKAYLRSQEFSFEKMATETLAVYELVLKKP